LLSFDNLNVVVCFTEHWVMEDPLSSVCIDQLRLVSSFSRSSRYCTGSGILHTKDVDYLKGLESENAFELSGVERLDFNFILAFIYRSPNRDFHEFFI